MTLRYPIINQTVGVRVWNSDYYANPNLVILYWGRRTFGPIDIRTMHILFADD